MKLTELRVNQVETPMGFQITPLSFSWKVVEAGEAKRQKWAGIRIWRNAGQEKEKIFDSGQDENADSLDYQVSLDLAPRTRYTWQVQVTADNGETARAESWFETGKGQEAWSGHWITADMGADTPAVLQRRFTVAGLEGVRKAAGAVASRLYICGLGMYEVYLNGEKVGSEYLAPGYHSYDFHLQAKTYDVTEYLREGENEIRIWLGDGWFRGRLGFDGGYTNLYGDRCYAIAEGTSLYDGPRYL